jgi:hypothetical protein
MFNTTLFQIFAGLQTTRFVQGTGLSLFRDFVEDPQLNGPVSDFRIGPSLQYNRNSFATFINSNSSIETASFDQPRFEYTTDGSDFQGLLIEGPSTNLIQYSTDFTNAGWISPLSGISVTSNVPSVSAPDNTETVSLITSTTATGPHVISWLGTPAPTEFEPVSAADFYTRSIFVKKETARYIVFSVSPEPSAATGGGNINFSEITNILDIDTGQFTQFSQLITSVILYKDGWVRVNFGRLSSNDMTNRLTVGISNGPEYSDTFFTGDSDGLSGVYVWGAQVELGTLATSYIPTNGTEVSRAQDEITIINKPFLNFYNNLSSSFFINFSQNTITEPGTFATFTNNIRTKYWTLNNSITPNQHSFTVVPGTSSIQTGNILANTFYTLAIGFTPEEFTLFQDGTLIDSLTGNLPPQPPAGPTQFQLGRFFDENYFNGHIRRFGYWPIRLSNEQLSSLE